MKIGDKLYCKINYNYNTNKQSLTFKKGKYYHLIDIMIDEIETINLYTYVLDDVETGYREFFYANNEKETSCIFYTQKELRKRKIDEIRKGR